MKTSITIQAKSPAPRTADYRGQTYVGLKLGQRYELLVTNRTAQRVLAVVTVDGRNVIDGRPGSVGGSGMIIPAHSTHAIEGWRTDTATVAAFRLSHPDEAYALNLGTSDNLGVIGLAVFAERSRRRTPDYSPAVTRCAGPTRGSLEGGSRLLSAGTSFGESRQSHVTLTTFERATTVPFELHTLRYDDVNALIEQGILSAVEPRSPNPFPGDDRPEFCKPA